MRDKLFDLSLKFHRWQEHTLLPGRSPLRNHGARLQECHVFVQETVLSRYPDILRSSP